MYFRKVIWDMETLAVIEREPSPYEGAADLMRGNSGQTAYNNVQTAKDTASLAQAQGLQSLTGQEGQQAYGAIQQMLANPGYTQAEKTATTGATDSGVAGSYDAAAANASNRVARTGNSAGYSSLADSLARGKAQTMATTNAGLQGQFANARMQQQQQGIGDLTSLYGGNQSNITNLLKSNNPNFQNYGSGFSLNLGKLGSFGASGS